MWATRGKGSAQGALSDWYLQCYCIVRNRTAPCNERPARIQKCSNSDRKSDATFAASYNLFKLPLGLTLMNASGLSEEFKKSNISCPLLRWCSRCTSSGGGSFCMWHMRASAAVYRFWGWSYFNL
eukprot:scaffold11084_cov19-Tisochrysis_lutea.AAC.1